MIEIERVRENQGFFDCCNTFFIW